ncbi:MAG TPA: response regulator, partial [Polyangiaceae bacterium]|nr:response regulator [Polyangiaceae bacterium]
QLLPAAFRIHYFLSLAAALVLMLSVFVNRRRVHQHVMSLRTSDLRLASSLKEALERSELRLRERQQTDLRRQELEDQLRQAQKLEAVGVLAGGVAHDMNNVLGAITSIASLASDRVEPVSPLHQDISDILAAARRGSALTRNLLGFARQGTRIAERFRMETTVESIAHLLKRTVSKQIELRVEAGAELDDIVGDQGQLSHVLMNLCINAVDATQGRGIITVRATNLWIDSDLALKHDIPVGRYIELAVEDDGCGIPADVLPRVFEPFFSTKSCNERSGLGLSMVYGTVRDHGGAVSIESILGQGTKVRVFLPSQVKRPASVAPPAVRAIRPADARRTILLVDDEPLLRSAGRRIIKTIGFDALVAANGAEAVAVFRRQHESIALVILDVAMPIMGGRDCFWRLREVDPDVPVLVASGYAKHGDVDELLAAGATGYLSKPYDRDQMATAIHRCLALSLTMAAGQAVSEAPPSQRKAVLS